MNKQKICIVTGSRAEYGLLYWVIKRFHEDPSSDLQLVVTGMHLSPEFGLTYQQIEKDGFTIARKAEILLSSDTPVGITKSIGLGNIAFAEIFADLKPELIIVLGDRFEIFAAVTAAMVARIPVAHCHGGELTLGAIDNAFRHAITKMSHLHFTATEEYRNRVMQLGEPPEFVFCVGALGIENINRLKLLDKIEFEESVNFKLKKRNLLITYHPVTLENNTAGHQFGELLKVLDQLADTGLLFTLPNADTDGRIIIRQINDFVVKNSNRAIAFESLGQLRFLSALKYMDAVIGNSSSGVIEAPSFKIGTVNIGERQKGRIKPDSVINCDPDFLSIKKAIDKVYSKKFNAVLSRVENPYAKGNASEHIFSIIKNTDWRKITKKKFYDWK